MGGRPAQVPHQSSSSERRACTAGKFELKQSAQGQCMVNLKAGNKQAILSSELYSDKASAHDGIASVKKNASTDAHYERKTSKKGEPFFVLQAPNGQIIGKRETSASATAMETGIASVKANAPGASVAEVIE